MVPWRSDKGAAKLRSAGGFWESFVPTSLEREATFALFLLMTMVTKAQMLRIVVWRTKPHPWWHHWALNMASRCQHILSPVGGNNPHLIMDPLFATCSQMYSNLTQKQGPNLPQSYSWFSINQPGAGKALISWDFSKDYCPRVQLQAFSTSHYQDPVGS